MATASGELQKLRLGPEAQRYSLDQLAATILAVARDARANAADAYAQRSQEFLDPAVAPRLRNRDELRKLMRRLD